MTDRSLQRMIHVGCKQLQVPGACAIGEAEMRCFTMGSRTQREEAAAQTKKTSLFDEIRVLCSYFFGCLLLKNLNCHSYL